MSHGKLGAIIVGNQLAEQPDPGEAAAQGVVVQVEKNEPSTFTDSGFVCFLDSCPDDRELGPEDGIIMCLHCLLEVHPEAAVGLDLAKEHGRAINKEGTWHPLEEEPA